MTLLQDVARTYEFLADSYLATLAIALVIAYLGVFVVLKRIVFLGITLAQAAAAGIALAFYVQGSLGHDTAFAEAFEAYGPTGTALGVSTLAVAGFAIPAESKRISREALLGLGYALFGGASILLVWRSAKGIDELKNLLAGDVLFAHAQLGTLLAGLAVVALVHVLLRKEFLLASYDPEFARTLRAPVRLYELLLALSLGVAVSLALKVAGVLLVFAFLAVPPIAGLSLGRKLGEATLIALGVAAVASWAGFYAAYRADLPIAPTIACLVVALAALAAAAARFGDAGRRAFVALLVPLSVASLASAADAAATRAGVFRASAPRTADVAAPTSETSSSRLLEVFKTAASAEVRRDAAKRIVEQPDDRLLESFVSVALGDQDEDVREVALGALEHFADRKRAVSAVERLCKSDDPDLQVHAALGLVRLGDGRGIGALVGVLADANASVERKLEASDALVKLNPPGKTWGYDPFADAAQNHKAVLRWEEWWRSQGTRVPK